MILIRMRGLRLPALLLGILPALSPAQGLQRYTVSGTVLNAVTNEPIRRALVGVGGSLVFTGPDGRFQVENVPGGPAIVAAQKPGFSECSQWDCGANLSRTMVTITVGSGTNDVLLKLVPESRIQGRIVDEDGEPISNIDVQLLSERVLDGSKQLRREGGAQTDDNGNYRIEGLTSGSYLIRTALTPGLVGWQEGFSGRPSLSQVYPERFYPNTPDRASAQPLELRAGQVGEADFTLEPVPAFRISGSVTPLVPGLGISYEDAEGQRVGTPALFDPKSGHFALTFTPAGTWTLVFESADSENRAYYARETVTVSSKNVDGLRVLLQPLALVPVNVTNAENEEARQVPLQLEPVDGDPSRALFAGRLNGNRPYGIANVPPGKYRVIVHLAGSQCIDSLTSGNTDLTRDHLVVGAGVEPQPINLTLRSDCAALQVTARSRKQNEKTNIIVTSTILAIPPLITQLEPGGSFTFTGLTPGDYSAYAFGDINGLEYGNPEAMRRFSGQQITLSANQHATLTLEVIGREDK